jgi:hypothetical protein
MGQFPSAGLAVVGQQFLEISNFGVSIQPPPGGRRTVAVECGIYTNVQFTRRFVENKN